MKVPFLDLNAVHKPQIDTLTQAFSSVLDRNAFILGFIFSLFQTVAIKIKLNSL